MSYEQPAATDAVEEFKDTWNFLGPATVVDPIPVQMHHSLAIPPAASERSIWIACGSWAQQGAGDQWFLQGHLEFFLNNRPTGKILFGDCSDAMPAATRWLAGRPVLQMRSGAEQPVLRYADVLPIYKSSLDLPCLKIRVEADQVRYFVDKSYYSIGAGTLSLLTGLRVVSS